MKAVRRLGGWAVSGALAAFALTDYPPNRLTAQWRPDERVLISDFSVVDAVAASPWLVFAATRHGLLIYDRVMGEWRPPVTTLDGYPTSRVRAAIADPAGNAVWLSVGGVDGYVRYDVDGRLWSRGTPPPPPPDAPVLTVEAALARAPAADALRALILTDPRLRSYQFTAAAGTPDRPELYFGTNGMGLVRVNPQTGEWEALPYGLVAPGVGAIAAAPDGGGGGIWAATSARPGERRGLTWVATDLSATRPTEGGGAALGFTFLSARRLLAARGALWLATEQGVLRIEPATLRGRRFDLERVTSLAPAPDGVWVGSTRGLSVITDDGRVEPVGAREVVVLSLLAVHDTLWVGTVAGVGWLPPGASAVTSPPELAERPSLRVPILALARARDAIVVATERELAWRAATGAWSVLPVPLALGVPTVLAADPDGGVWIGGTHGLAHADLGRAFIRTLTVPVDLPAAVRDVLADRAYLWTATDSGLVRFDRRAALNR
jgi:ligand-binding sensor domain-containing protein